MFERQTLRADAVLAETFLFLEEDCYDNNHREVRVGDLVAEISESMEHLQAAGWEFDLGDIFFQSPDAAFGGARLAESGKVECENVFLPNSEADWVEENFRHLAETVRYYSMFNPNSVPLGRDRLYDRERSYFDRSVGKKVTYRTLSLRRAAIGSK